MLPLPLQRQRLQPSCSISVAGSRDVLRSRWIGLAKRSQQRRRAPPPLQPVAAAAAAEPLGSGTLGYGVASTQGPREQMEDCAMVVPDGCCGYLYALVFDGHSGHAASEWLRDKMYDVIRRVVLSEDGGTPPSGEGSAGGGTEVGVDGVTCPIDLQNHLAESFRQADSVLLAELERHADPEQRASGSTATVGLVREDKVIVANVGDSRAVLCRGGRAKDLTVEHRAYGRSATVDGEIARIEAGGGWVKNGRVCDVLAVSRTFGDRNFKGPGLQRMLADGVEHGWWDQDFADARVFTADPIIADPDVVQLERVPEDEFLIVATDGLWDVFTSEEAVQLTRKEIMTKGADAQGAADKLVSWALKRYTADNVAVVVVDLGICAKAAAKGGGKKAAGKGGLFGGLFGR